MADKTVRRKPNPILVVDDEELNREVLSRRLRKAGYQVEVASDAASALEIIKQHELEMVLLDSMMPGMNGLDLLRLLRGAYSPSDLPVLMVTALSESDRMVEALELGANDYITKPIDFPVVLARIKTQVIRKDAESALRESEERHSLAALGANDGIWDWDLTTDIIYYSDRWKEMLGYSLSEIGVSPQEWLGRVHPEEFKDLMAELNMHRAQGSPGTFFYEHRILHKDGTYRWVLSRGLVRRDRNGVACRIAGSLTDITQSKSFDSLTGLPNRGMFLEVLSQALVNADRDTQQAFTLLFLDLDRFKIVNESMGHLAGDELLNEVARRLRFSVRCDLINERPNDFVARLGGDEFGIILAQTMTEANAMTAVRRLQDQLQKPMIIEGREIFPKASIGIAIWKPGYSSNAEILRDADTAMYRAKSRGRSQAVLFNTEMRTRAVERMELESSLLRAIEQKQFVVYYQPTICLKESKLVGFEALVRWNHPQKGILAPLHFIQVAEETGLIVQIGMQVLREACVTTRRWQAEFPQTPPIDVSVNMSVRQMRHFGVVDEVSKVLKETELPPELLKLEITESVLIDDIQSAARVLYGLKSLGIGLKIDDFGTGYSSLQYLTRLPFDTLKIDRSFVTHMCVDEQSHDVIRTIADLAKSLNMDVVAEGVEAEDQAKELLGLGCGYAQGYLFAKPLSTSDAELYIRKSQQI